MYKNRIGNIVLYQGQLDLRQSGNKHVTLYVGLVVSQNYDSYEVYWWDNGQFVYSSTNSAHVLYSIGKVSSFTHDNFTLEVID